MKKIIIVIVAVVALLGFFAFGTYNRLVTLDERSTTQWKQVEVQYQRRFDLIPNLVNAVKGVMTQEQTIFDAIATARTNYSGAQTADDRAKAATQVEGALGRLLVITENYPILKSSENVQALTAELAGTENRIAVARKDFNDSVNTYNLVVRRFPTSLIASISGFDQKAYFAAAAGSDVVPQVDLVN